MSLRTARGLVLRAVLLFCGGCNLGLRDTTPDPPVYTVPQITAAGVDCDPSVPLWTVTAETDAWTGNGRVYLSTDGVYVESHPLGSIAAAADGSSDSLRVRLGIVAEWRDVDSGASTVFNCETPDLAGVLQVYTRTGDGVADCRSFGEEVDRWADWDPDVQCTIPLEPDDSGSTPAEG